MKQILYFLSIIFLLVGCDNSDDEDNGNKPPKITHQWEQVPTFPGIERENATSFVIADKFYVGLGRGAKGDTVQSLTDFYEYNPTSKTWKQIANFPGISRQFAIGFTLNNKGYVGIGQKFVCAVNRNCEITDLFDFWEYDPLNNTWKKVATFDIPEYQKWVGSVVSLNNKAYILYDNFIWEFSAVDYSLTKKARSPEVNTYATSFTLNNKGYFGTGGGNNILKSFYEYDPAIDKWTKKADFGGVGRRGAVGFSLDGKGYIGCGEGYEILPGRFTFPMLNDFWEYNTQLDKWNKVTELPTGKLQYAVSGVVQGRVIIGTGRNEHQLNLKDFWLY